MLAGMIKIQNSLSLLEAILLHVPNPHTAISDHNHLASDSQSLTAGLGLHTPPKLQRFTLPRHHMFLRNHAAPARSLPGMIQPVYDRPLDLMPRHPLQGIALLLASPILPALTRHPSVHHDNQCRRYGK